MFRGIAASWPIVDYAQRVQEFSGGVWHFQDDVGGEFVFIAQHKKEQNRATRHDFWA